MSSHKQAYPKPIVVLGLPLGRPILQAQLALISPYLVRAQRIVGFPATLSAIEQALPDSIPVERLALPLEHSVRKLKAFQAQGEDLLVLTSGDPLFFGLGASLLRYFKPDELILHPNLSSLQLASAKCAMAWHNMCALSLHGREDFSHLANALTQNKPICLLLDAKHDCASVARYLKEKGCLTHILHLCTNLGSNNEMCQTISLDQAEQTSSSAQALLILEPKTKTTPPIFGASEQFLTTSDYCSQLPIRATALALLQIEPTDTVWDLGSGSGAVALDAAALAHQGQIWAIEQNPSRAERIRQAIISACAWHINLCQGRAQDVLSSLPRPKRVFMGGGLSTKPVPLLDAVTEQILPQGRLVASCVLLASLTTLRNYFAQRGWPVTIHQLAMASAQPLAEDLYLAARNPTFLVAVEKPA